MREGLPPLPQEMQHLPEDSRGYPIPWFVAWYDGKPDFRVVDTKKIKTAVYEHLCWICGGKITKEFVFVKPASALSDRMALEPASHRDCAQWAVRACPFMLSPKAQYRPTRDDAVPVDGVERKNPGMFMLWATHTFRPFGPSGGGLAIELGQPHDVLYYTEGRTARPDEIRSYLNGAHT